MIVSGFDSSALVLMNGLLDLVRLVVWTLAVVGGLLVCLAAALLVSSVRKP